MNLISAVQSSLLQYVGIHGRACRSEYWWFILFTWILIGFVRLVFGEGVELIVIFVILFPKISVSIRRSHDINISGWWILPYLIIYFLVLAETLVPTGTYSFPHLIFVYMAIGAVYIYLYTKKGDVGGNRYGADPLAVEADVDVSQT
ncbi:MAG: DUF805 domain-containing protein [Rhizobiales bacterium]|nr:DUF805 domain-containing protein [Hyphomicrobiales bacterium]